MSRQIDLFQNTFDVAIFDDHTPNEARSELFSMIQTAHGLVEQAKLDKEKFLTSTKIAVVPKNNSCANVTLPPLQIPDFDGDLLKFEQFWSLFSTNIDNNNTLTDAAKFSYLVIYLKDEAANVVSGLIASPGSYRVAVELLKNVTVIIVS